MENVFAEHGGILGFRVCIVMEVGAGPAVHDARAHELRSGDDELASGWQFWGAVDRPYFPVSNLEFF